VTDPSKNRDEEVLTAKDLQNWLRQEVADSAKALELRLREATALVADYSQGKISPEDAAQKTYAFSRRWGDALPGTSAAPGRSDAEILEAIDKARESKARPRDFTDFADRGGSGRNTSR